MKTPEFVWNANATRRHIARPGRLAGGGRLSLCPASFFCLTRQQVSRLATTIDLDALPVCKRCEIEWADPLVGFQR